jgi:hypothetical protein
MKKNLSENEIAIILSSLAIVISLMQPVYNLITIITTEPSRKPSFDVNSPNVHDTYTYLIIHNNGTAIARNVKVLIIFGDHGLTSWAETQFIPEIEENEYSSMWFPIGQYHLGTNASDYELYVSILCFGLTTEFHFKDFIP